MIETLRQYKWSALLAMACGLVSAALGIFAMAAPGKENASYLAVMATMVMNTALHYESCCTSYIREKRKQPNVLSMAVAESVLLLFFGVCLVKMGWTEFVILLSVYLVFNGTSLTAIPSAFARGCGIVTIVLGAALFLFGRESGPAGAVLVDVNLIVNGAERIIMSGLNGKKRK